MQRLTKYLIYLISIITTSLFLVVIISENTNLVHNIYKTKIVAEIETITSLKVKIDSVKVKWNGITPKFSLIKISLHNKKKQDTLLEGNELIVSLDLFKSILEQKIILTELNLVKSNIKLVYLKNSLYLKNYDIFNFRDDENNSSVNTNNETLKFRISNSEVIIENDSSNNKYKFSNTNLVLFKESENIKIFSTFNHNSPSEVIHLAANFNFDANNKINGRLYSQGLNLNLGNVPVISDNIDYSVLKLNYTIWADMKNGLIKTAEGLFNTSNVALKNNKGGGEFIFKNTSSHFNYKYNKTLHNIVLSNLNMSTNSNSYFDNEVLVNYQNHNLSDLFVKQIYINDFKKILTLYPGKEREKLIKKSSNINKGSLEKLMISGLQKKNKAKYSSNFNNINVKNISNKYNIHNISGNISGNLKKGSLVIESKDLNVVIDKEKDINLSKVNGILYYQFINNKIFINSNKINVEDSQSIKISGDFHKGKSKIRLIIKGEIKPIADKFSKSYIFTKLANNITLSGEYGLDFRSYQDKNKTNTYGVLNISNFVIKNSKNNMVINSPNVRVNFLDRYFISLKNKYFINNQEFDFYLNTDVLNGRPKYSFQSNGIIRVSFLQDIFESKYLNNFKGQSFAKTYFYYEPDSTSKKIYLNLISDLEGISFNIMSPIEKTVNEKKIFKMSYNFEKKYKNKLNILYDKHSLVITAKKDNTLIDVTSTYLKGNILVPENITSTERINAKLSYFDFNRFKSKSRPMEFPYMKISINKAKIQEFYLDNVTLVTSPNNGGVVLENFSFINNDLSMEGNGKWVVSDDKEITFFDARFKSDNFGAALNSLGFSGLVNKGTLDSQLIGQWKGSPQMFGFSSFDGKVILDMKNGEFLQVTKETKAIGKLLGLLSISSLQKRLTLDFSDFFSSGLSFENVKGELIFDNSKANINNMVLDGSFGEMRLTGETDLEKETYNQKLVYIPDLSSMSLITGTLLGGPVGAVASIFYDKVLKELGINTNKLAAVEYSITGSWDKPNIKVIEAFKPLLN